MRTDNRDNKTSNAVQAKHASGKTAGRRKSPSGKQSGPKRIKLIGVFLMLLIMAVLIAKIVEYKNWQTDVRVTDEGLVHASQFDDCLVLNGIDVSAFQNDDIEWKKVKSSGVDFVFIRAGYRGTEKGELFADKTFETKYDAAEKAGLMVGAYFYSQAMTPDEAVEEAEKLLEIIDGRQMDLPLVIDYELFSGGRLDEKIKEGGMDYAQIYHDIVLAFCKTVEDAGYDSAIYANTDMFTHYMDASLIDTSTNLWVADFSSRCHLNAGYRFWQCSDAVQIGGTDQLVDHDVLYLNQNGATRVYSADADKRKSLDSCSVVFKKDAAKYKISGAKAKLNVVDAEGKKMRKNKDYVVSYVKNMERGTGYAVVRGINGYRDIIIAPFTIR